MREDDNVWRSPFGRTLIGSVAVAAVAGFALAAGAFNSSDGSAGEDRSEVRASIPDQVAATPQAATGEIYADEGELSDESAEEDEATRGESADLNESPLQLMLTTSDRQKLANGNELLTISGRVINSTDREQAVPPIQAELRDAESNALIYSWVIAAPAGSLAPGSAASFNSAEVDVPEGGESLSLKFKNDG